MISCGISDHGHPKSTSTTVTVMALDMPRRSLEWQPILRCLFGSFVYGVSREPNKVHNHVIFGGAYEKLAVEALCTLRVATEATGKMHTMQVVDVMRRAARALPPGSEPLTATNDRSIATHHGHPKS